MKRAGVNTIRMYYASPITRLYTEQVLNGNIKGINHSELKLTSKGVGGNLAPPPYGANHIPFFDTAQKYGLMIIWPLVSDQSLVYTAPQNVVEQYIMNQVMLKYLILNEQD